ncbi:MAG TPA: hypothetical protein VG602_00145 [Actinomycetota bacterium]|nr:hypothetical protein [Actinomycetota bacterium]
MANKQTTRSTSKPASGASSPDSLPKLVKEMSTSFARLADAVRASTDEIRDALDEQQDSIGEVPGQLAEGMAAVRDAIADLTETQSLVEERLADVATSVVTSAEVEKAIESALTDAATSVSEEQARGAERASERIEQALAALARRLGQAVSAIRDEARQAVGAAREEVMAVSRTLEELRAKYEARADAIESGLGRVDRLAEVIESLGRRRGFKDLVESEQRLAQHQEALTARIADASGELSARIGVLEARLQSVAEAVDVEALHPVLADRAAQAVDELRTSLAGELGERVSVGMDGVTDAVRDRIDEALPTAIDELRTTITEGIDAEIEGTVERAATPLREDLADIKRKIAAWGRVRSAPRIAEEIGTLDERLTEVEQAVQEDLVEQVFDRMQRAFDRRFEVLIQLIETRLRDAGAPTAEPERRGLFRRSRELE